MKKKITKIMLCMLPLMALILATTGDSVHLVNMTTGERTAGSYFTMLENSPAAVCPVLAATCSIVSFAAAVIWLYVKKHNILRISCWASFVGACFAVLPMEARGQFMILPNVLFPILLAAHFILGAFSKKMNLEKQEQPQGKRLERH